MRTSRHLALICVTLAAAFVMLHPTAAARADAAWKVIFNGLPSETVIQETETGRILPVSFQVPPAGHRRQYSVWIETDASGNAVNVSRVLKENVTRGPGDCRWCNGSKKCQDCYPAGSKVNTGGMPCIGCDATGSCNFCQGSGVCWTCDGRGFNTGCPDCSKVVASQE